MKTIIDLLSTIIILSTTSVNVVAQDPSSSWIFQGITSDGIAYQVYGDTISTTSNSITVTRTIIYEGQVTPTFSRSWIETINGVTYSGTLYLYYSDYDADTNQTTAVYRGTLTSNS